MRQVHRLFQRFSLIVAMLFASIVAALAQNTIRGTILDAGGEPLIGATVVMKGKPSVAAVTDFDSLFLTWEWSPRRLSLSRDMRQKSS